MGQKQSGFTLVEIAIVLVIIGLLLGGVLTVSYTHLTLPTNREV